MRFTCEKSLLVQGLNIAGRTVAQKSSLSVIEGILCKAGHGLNLTGYNMETAITFNVEAEVSDPGECILPAKLFGDIVRRLPEGPVTVVVDDNFKVSIRAGYASFTISAESADDYPDLPDVNTGRAIKIPQNKLKELIGGTISRFLKTRAAPSTPALSLKSAKMPSPPLRWTASVWPAGPTILKKPPAGN